MKFIICTCMHHTGRLYQGPGATSFTYCSAGYFQPNTRQACMASPAGSCVGSAAIIATPCSRRSYQPNTGQTSCIASPAGSYGRAGAMIAIPCSAETINRIQGRHRASHRRRDRLSLIPAPSRRLHAPSSSTQHGADLHALHRLRDRMSPAAQLHQCYALPAATNQIPARHPASWPVSDTTCLTLARPAKINAPQARRRLRQEPRPASQTRSPLHRRLLTSPTWQRWKALRN